MASPSKPKGARSPAAGARLVPAQRKAWNNPGPRPTTVLGYARRYAFPQWLRTTVAVILWVGMINLYTGVISTYNVASSARTMGIGLAIFTGIACHLWPTRTPPWRTVAITGIMTAFLGANALSLGFDRFALALVTVVGFGFVLLRLNQNARKIWSLFQTWRLLR